MGMKCPKCESNNTDTQKFCGECATPLPSSEDIQVSHTKTLETPTKGLTKGTTFASRYEVIEELGKGGMGQVYRVKDVKLDEEMALKVLKPEIAADKGMIERFKNELKLARKIAHKSICKMYDLNEEEETPYITMEYVKGEDLKSFIRKKGKLTEEETIAIAKQVCEGLEEAHELGVIHRDLKPQNIMIDEKSNAKVMDFGIARSVEAPGITHTGMMIGTPDYISPEQAGGEEADQRSDIYALGVILYEMVTGRVPFKGDTALSVALKHKAQLPKEPRKLNPEVSESLSRLILVCMEKDRERRYKRAKELLADLRNIEEGFPLGTKIRPRRETFVATLIRKKLFIPALIIALAIIAVVVWQFLPKAPGITSIAVLPFKDLSPDKDQEYFCDGIADELINRMTNIESIRVPARTSAFSFKGKDLDIQEIGEKLNVEMMLDGSVRKAGNKLRITTQLVKTSDGYPIWSKIYEGNIEDTFVLQDEISLAIVDNLKLNLLEGERENLIKRYTENVEAYNLYLQGRFFWYKRTKEGAKKAIEYFEQSIKKDPSYALAYAGLADSCLLLPFYFPVSPKEIYPKAKEAVTKALEIDNTLSEAHTSLALIKGSYDWDWVGAEKEYKRAIDLNPNYALAHHWYAWLLMWTARFNEAIEEIKRARELDPLSLIINRDIGTVLLFAGQYDQTIKAIQKTLEMSPNFPQARLYLARAYFLKSKYEKALAELQKEKELIDWDPLVESWIGICYMKMGKRVKTQEVLDELIKRSKQAYISSYHIALVYFALEENDQGYKWLDKAYNERSVYLCFLRIEPILSNFRSDSRFQDLLHLIGFPERETIK